MQNLYITHYSIGFICPAVLSLIISLVIVFRQVKRRDFSSDRISLACYFCGTSIYNIMNFFGFSVYSPAAQSIWYIESFSPFAVLFIIRFAYYYPSGWRAGERKSVFILFSLLAAAVIAEYWINSWDSPVLLYGHTYGAENSSRAIPLIIIFFYLWGASVFIRKATESEREHDPFKKLTVIMLKPETVQGRICRTFAFLILLDTIHSMVVYSVMNMITASAFIISLSTAILVLVIYSLYAGVYLSSAYDNIPFIYKLTGIPLVIVMFIVTASGYMMMYFRSISYDEMKRAVIPVSQSDSGYPAGTASAAYVASCEGSVWKIIYDKNGNLPGELTGRLWGDTPSGVQMKSKRAISVTDKVDCERKFFIQINKENYQQYNRKIGNKIYGFGFPYTEYLAYMHGPGLLIISTMIVSLMVIIIALPVLYYFGIIGPLRRIIRRSSGSNEFSMPQENELTQIENILKRTSESRKGKPLPVKPDEVSTALRKKLDIISDYLRDNYHDEISREGLAGMVDLDPDYMSRLFKIYTGMKIGDYTNSLRIEEACSLLLETRHSILDISIISGFENLRTFNRAFIKLKGETPHPSEAKT